MSEEIEQIVLTSKISVEIPPLNLQTIYLGGLFTLALLACCYVAEPILMPIVMACLLKLVFQPIMRLLEKCKIPRSIAAFLIIAIGLGVVLIAVATLYAPATLWIHDLPQQAPKIRARLYFLSAPVQNLQTSISHVENIAGTKDPKTMTVAVAGASFLDKIISITGNFATGLLETILVLFFMLMSGDTFLRRLVEILPSLKNKKQAINIFQQIESDISAYLATITVMNLFVGVATTLIMLVCGVRDPFLWGTMAFLFNYIPILGPIAAFIAFAMVGLLSDQSFWIALTPAGLYFIVHLIEGETLTPLLLARRFTLNPVLVILTLIFWYWMWGIPGAIIAMPVLAIAKIICDHIEGLKGFGHFIEG